MEQTPSQYSRPESGKLIHQNRIIPSRDSSSLPTPVVDGILVSSLPLEFPRSAVSSSVQNCKSLTGAASSIKQEQKIGSIVNGDWSPEDDGIAIRLPSSVTDESPARGEVDAYIHNILYGPSRRRRLKVFAEICPEQFSDSQ